MKYNSKIKSKQTDGFFEAILALENMEECYRFFEDICTVKEIQAISQRLEVVKLLVKGKTYHEIEGETGASTATISRINRSLNYGADGYKILLERLGYLSEKKEK
ncbi:YerC/YecD family TrpR-related protein [Peptoniphilus raoultii]|uniref:YerC/YecD family TrpR-related protein n=1 Tax=Peptoniphilus raoultii TaxID=1776387 RepID=UPI0008DA181C|nr:YerC/YecD family TrpR-related protein [Peptoniphilus raoultii]